MKMETAINETRNGISNKYEPNRNVSNPLPFEYLYVCVCVFVLFDWMA